MPVSGLRAQGRSVNIAASNTSTLNLQRLPDESDETKFNVLAPSRDSRRRSDTPAAARCIGANPRVQELMRRFVHHAYSSYTQGTPAIEHLCLLTRYNLSAALQRNADILGVKAAYLTCEGLSPFTKEEPTPILSNPQFNWPANLNPTPVQRSIKHHPWVDVFPWPQLRDNMLQAFEHPDLCNEDEMCRELVEYGNLDSKAFLVVWGDSWDFRNWEVTPEFLSKWGWLLSGCQDFLYATNYWRAKRSEKPITQRDVLEAIRLTTPAKLQCTEL
jgi:hypothetical protein